MACACWIFNSIFSFIFSAKPNYESQFITANILTLIVGPINPIENLLFLIVLAAAAMGSKYVLAYKKRHIFNPAAFGITFTALTMAEGASWWVGNQYILPIVLLGGVLIVLKLRWFHLVASFLATYILLGLTRSFDVTYLVNSALIFFAFVMLIEPLTAPSGKKNRILYGIGVALIIFLIQNFSNLPYSLELGLLTGNLGVFLIQRREKISLKFERKEQVAKNTFAFWWEPLKKINWQPGQFLEWSIPHPHPDSRGVRRWFTIASSPTEEKVLLTTKLYEKSSSFKSTLLNLKPGYEITVSEPDGDFVLPKDTTRKCLFIAGGTGITPFRSMVKYLLDSNQSQPIIMLYSVKTAEEVAFKEVWTEANKKFGLKPIFVITDQTGFITPEVIKKEAPDWQERLFYVSGPEPMVESFEKMLSDMDVRRENLKRDYFPGYSETYS